MDEQKDASKPVAWIRFCSDGCYEGPIMDHSMEEVRKKSGAWTPLYAVPFVPKGWKLVPEEPDMPMFTEGGDAFFRLAKTSWPSSEDQGASVEIYRSMLAAAPEYKGEPK